MFNPVAPYGYLLPNVYLFMADIANPDLSLGIGPAIAVSPPPLVGCVVWSNIL